MNGLRSRLPRAGSKYKEAEAMSGLKCGFIATVAAAVCAWTNLGIAQDFSVSGSTLTVKGDTGADNLTFTGGLLGEVVVTDGQGNEIDAFADIDRIEIDLRGGGDLLTLADLALDGGFVGVKLGADGDDVFVTGLIDADLILDGEGDADLFDLSGGATITGDLEIYGGLRNDDILLTGVVVNGDLLVDGQAGDEELNFDGLAVDGRTRIDLGVGDDSAVGSGAAFIGDVELIAGLGTDDVFNDANVYDGDLTVSLGGGEDDYEELGSTVNGDYHVNGGAGDDDFDDTGTVVVGSRTTTSV
jgi:large repetitive protein